MTRYGLLCMFTGYAGLCFGFATHATLGTGWALLIGGSGFALVFLLSTIGVEVAGDHDRP
jgi:hypothetical protein